MISAGVIIQAIIAGVISNIFNFRSIKYKLTPKIKSNMIIHIETVLMRVETYAYNRWWHGPVEH
jgi:hypothetical protein